MGKSTCRKVNIHDLHVAIATTKSNDSIKDMLLTGSGDVNQAVNGATALSLALYVNRSSAFAAILDNCCTAAVSSSSSSRNHWGVVNINKCSRDRQQRTEPPIVTATRMGSEMAVGRLLGLGADTEAVDNLGHTALWMAARQNQFAIAVELIRHNALVRPSAQVSWLPVFAAIRPASRRTDLARLLILAGADDRNVEGESLLARLVAPGRLDTAKLLVAACKVNVGNAIAFDGDADVAKYVRETYRQPVSLRDQCRWTVRRSVAATRQRGFLPAVAMLPLPRRLIDYVALLNEAEAFTDEPKDFVSGQSSVAKMSWGDVIRHLMMK